ncbi:MAG: DUF3179 domain-containing protein [Chloroflexi bacterium]|nr:DUF3179 domain-containing protein [Chloroflexota bacterium]
MRPERWPVFSTLIIIALAVAVLMLITALTGPDDAPLLSEANTVETPTPLTTAESSDATPLPGNLDSVTFIEDGMEYTIRQLIQRDGIRPIYNPVFTSAEEAPYSDDELVMGLEINGDARAYPVGLLRNREMVNDEVGGTPVLVTW